MNTPIQPMDLSAMFDRMFFLIGKTFVRNLIVALIFLLLPVIFMSVAANDFYSSLADMTNTYQLKPDVSNIFLFLGKLFFFLFATLLLALGALFAEIAIMIMVAGEMTDETISYPSAIVSTFKTKWIRAIGQALIKYSLVVGGIAIFGVIIAITAVAAGKSSESGSHLFLVAAIMLIIFFVVLPAIFFFIVRWFFTLTAIAVDDCTVIESFGKSWHLVRGYWWRTFGIMILMTIVAQFVIGIISAPLTFGSMWDVYKEFFTALGNSKGNLDPMAFQKIERSIGAGVGVGTGISSILGLLITPVFTVVMYFDLKARKHDFPEHPDAVISQPTPEQPV